MKDHASKACGIYLSRYTAMRMLEDRDHRMVRCCATLNDGSATDRFFILYYTLEYYLHLATLAYSWASQE